MFGDNWRLTDHWGQTPCAFVKLKAPCAFVKLKEGCDDVGAEELIKFCRDHLQHYMAPWTVTFGDLPKTSTGKTQKFILRERAKVMSSLS